MKHVLISIIRNKIILITAIILTNIVTQVRNLIELCLPSMWLMKEIAMASKDRYVLTCNQIFGQLC